MCPDAPRMNTRMCLLCMPSRAVEQNEDMSSAAPTLAQLPVNTYSRRLSRGTLKGRIREDQESTADSSQRTHLPCCRGKTESYRPTVCPCCTAKPGRVDIMASVDLPHGDSRLAGPCSRLETR